MTFKVDAGRLLHDGVDVASTAALVVDSGELKTMKAANGVIHVAMPHRIDGVFVAGSRVVGYESKTPTDFVTSKGMRRLARQVAVLLAEVDVPCLLLRGWPPVDDDVDDELVRLQALGFVLLPVAGDDVDVVAALGRYKTYLADGSRSALQSIAYTDVDLKPKSLADGKLLEAVKGIGPKTRKKLIADHGSVAAVLAAVAANDLDIDLPKATLKRLKEAAA